MFRRLLMFLSLTVLANAQEPLNEYKLLLNQSGTEKEVKDKVFRNLLEDMKANQDRLMSTIRGWSEQEVMEHFGRMAPQETISGPAAATDPEMVRTRIMRAIVDRQKEMARDIWLKMQNHSVEELKSDLGKTIAMDQEFRQEAEAKLAEAETTGQAGSPSAPWYRPVSSSYYNYYGYNYFYNYSQMGNYPYYNTYNYYSPYYTGNVYSWNARPYNQYYYQNYYYPRYNRTYRLYKSSLFGLATVAAFVDWLRY